MKTWQQKIKSINESTAFPGVESGGPTVLDILIALIVSAIIIYGFYLAMSHA